MKVALINPNWTFEGSVYFGCREPHLPLEFGYSKALLEKNNHEVLLIDGLLEDLSDQEIISRVSAFQPDLSVLTTTNSYLFWRCAQPELRVPALLVPELKKHSTITAAVGPHSSTTPAAALKKLNVDVVFMGECEELIAKFVEATDLDQIPSICYYRDEEIIVRGVPHASDMKLLPALKWDSNSIERHKHHHHRFDGTPVRPGAEMEFSRGCPYNCTFCAKENFRNIYRKRPLDTVLEELDSLLRQGVEYIYFIDEIFLPDRALLESLQERKIIFGIQTRIDLWKKEMLELLGKAGCVSIEAGIESISEEARGDLAKNCKLSTSQLTERLIYAKSYVPFVQANLLECEMDNSQEIEEWRKHLQQYGVWSNEPVPLFRYPGSPEYTRRWGPPDDFAWERASHHYLSTFKHFSDIQEQRPLELEELEASLK